MKTDNVIHKAAARFFERIPRWWIPYTVLAIALVLTALTTWLLWRSFHESYSQRFRSETSQIQSLLVSRMNAYEAILRSTSSMITMNPAIDQLSFHTYVDHLNIPLNYPGVQGIGYSVLVTADQEQQLIAHMRAGGMIDFKLWPESAQTERQAIIYLEPLDERNKRAIGYDMLSDPIRREAMQRACDTGQPASTTHVTLVQEDGRHQQPGFLMYVPVYQLVQGEMPQTVEQRRERLLGFAYSPFRVTDLITNVLAPVANSPIDIQIYDGDQPIESERIYQDTSFPLAASSFKEEQQLMIAGNVWTIMYSAPPDYERSSWLLLLLVLLVGLSFSSALFLFSRSQIYARYHAENAVRIRDSFLWIASHELRSPLTILLGNVQLLEMRVMRETGFWEQEHHNLQMIIQQGQRMHRMIGVLLDHAQIQTGALHIKLQYLDLVPLATRVIDELQEASEKHSLLFEAPAQLCIYGDELRLEQVFYNLIMNAIKYSPAGGSVMIRLLQEGQTAIVQVIDHGLGIPAKDQKDLFKEFYRASNVKERKINGSGLGLFVIHEIIRQHNGSIDVESELNEGSTFTICLPLASSD